MHRTFLLAPYGLYLGLDIANFGFYWQGKRGRTKPIFEEAKSYIQDFENSGHVCTGRPVTEKVKPLCW